MRICLLGMLTVLFAATTIQPASARTWCSRKGKRMKAELVRVEGAKAILKKEKDGQIVEIDLDRFADEDRKYLEAVRNGATPASTEEFEAPPSKKKTAPASRKKRNALPSQDKLIILGVILLVINIPIYLLLGKLMFGDLHDFMECVRFWLTPDIVSWFRGEGMEDWFGEMKLGFFFLLCIAAVVGEYFLLARYVFGWI